MCEKTHKSSCCLCLTNRLALEHQRWILMCELQSPPPSLTFMLILHAPTSTIIIPLTFIQLTALILLPIKLLILCPRAMHGPTTLHTHRRRGIYWKLRPAQDLNEDRQIVGLDNMWCVSAIFADVGIPPFLLWYLAVIFLTLNLKKWPFLTVFPPPEHKKHSNTCKKTILLENTKTRKKITGI